MAKILMVEDDRDLTLMVSDWLKLEHHQVECVHNGPDALEFLRNFDYDIVILDWELPGLSGIDILKDFRLQGKKTPVLILTGKRSVSEKEVGLDTGADDYLTKPFDLRELTARLRALLRRGWELGSNVLTFSDIVLDPSAHSARRGNRNLQLLRREFSLLEFLMRHPNQLFSAESLLSHVWTAEADVGPETVRTCVKRLRQKLESQGEPEVIQTVRGVGYKLGTH